MAAAHLSYSHARGPFLSASYIPSSFRPVVSIPRCTPNKSIEHQLLYMNIFKFSLSLSLSLSLSRSLSLALHLWACRSSCNRFVSAGLGNYGGGDDLGEVVEMPKGNAEVGVQSVRWRGARGFQRAVAVGI